MPPIHWHTEKRIPDGHTVLRWTELPEVPQPEPEPTLRDWFPPRTWPWLAALVTLIVVAVIKTL